MSLKVLRPTILRLRLRFDATVLDDHSRRRLATGCADSLHRSHHLHTAHHLVSRALVSIAMVKTSSTIRPQTTCLHHTWRYLLWRYLLWRYLLWRYLLWRYLLWLRLTEDDMFAVKVRRGHGGDEELCLQ